MGARMAGSIRIGVGGWTYEPWDESFYPSDLKKKDQLRYSASQLTAIEINGTFYRTQRPETFQAWTDAVPDDFVFAVKAPRYAVNRKVLAEGAESIGRFVESGLDRLGGKLGPILWQLPPTKKYEPDDFAAFLDLLPARAGDAALRHAVELRHPSFEDAGAVEACRDRNVAIVLAGDSDYPLIADQTADFTYLRIMGTTEGHPLGYASSKLDQWAERARTLAAGRQPDDLAGIVPTTGATARDVFLFVISGHKAANPAAAMALIERLG